MLEIEDCLRVIYEAGACGWQVEDWPKTISPDGRKTFGVPQPQEDTPEGLAEFGRLVAWAWREFEELHLVTVPGEGKFIAWIDHVRGQADTCPQEAFIRALTTAIEARSEKG